jgi:ABC-type transport system involved in cytochrome bd biosynthesis fused ATPase/permease subunit
MKPRYQSITLYERTVHTMFGTLLLLALVYCVVLLSIVFSVIERKQDDIASRDLTSRLASFEATYANTVAGINDSTLAQNNFKRVDGTTFAVRKDPIASYTVLYAR